MTTERKVGFWLAGLAFLILILVLLSNILLPFVAGMAIAYFFDPLCDRLEKLGLSRTWATVLVTLLFLVGALLVALLVIPLAFDQLRKLIALAPDLIGYVRQVLQGLIAALEERFGPETAQRMREAVLGSPGDIAQLGQGVVDQIVARGLGFANFLSLLFITPVVAFYLLRDWDKLVARIDSWLPRRHAPTIRELARETDEILSGYVRGVGTVCLTLGAYYSIGLIIIGLDFALIVGLIAGLLSFIPYVGAIGGLVLSVGLALFQFDSIWLVVATAALFLSGQALEGNVLTPKLVGEKVNLHPAVVIFALLAGGSLFGFTGLLLSMPVAAVIGVLLRFTIGQYLKSPLYGAKCAPLPPPVAPRDDDPTHP